MTKLFEEGEGGAVAGSSNVTTGVAIKETPLPPSRRQKKMESFETVIDKTISKTAAKILEGVLQEANLRDHVEVEGKKGRVEGTSGGTEGHEKRVSVRFEDGTHKSYPANYPGLKVTRAGSQLDTQASHHFKDAEVARRQVQRGRMHDSSAKGHALLARHHEHEGNKAKAAEHKALSDEHAQKAKEAFKDAEKGKNQWIDTHEMHRNERNAMRKRADAVKNAPKYSYHHYYNVPFADKDKAKAAGMKWDPTEKKWYVGSEMRYHKAHGPQPWKFAHTYDNTFRKKHDD